MPRPKEHLRIAHDAARLLGHLGLTRLSRPLVRQVERRIADDLRGGADGRLAPVDRIEDITPAVFQDYVRRGVPLVLPGFSKHWPCVQTWSPSYLAERYGDDIFLMSDRDDGASAHNAVAGKAQEARLSEVVTRMKAGRRVNTGFDSLLHRHPELQDDFLFDEYRALLPEDAKVGIRDTFMGAKGSATDIHSALNNNLFTCVYGIKRWTFFHPKLDWAFRPDELRAPYFSSHCNPEDPDHTAFPLFRWADGLQVELQPGDSLYLPPLWWHYVVNAEHAIGVGFRWINLKQALKTAPIKTITVLTATNPSVIAVERAKRNNDFSMPFRLREELLD